MPQQKASLEKTLQSAFKHKRAGTEVATAIAGIEAMVVSGITTNAITENTDVAKLRKMRAAIAHKEYGKRMADAITTLDAILATEGYADGVEATASLATTAPIVLKSVAAGTARNTNTFTSQVLAAAANPTNTVLAAFTGTAAAIVCTVTPNDGTNNPANVAATASLAVTTPIALTSVAAGVGRNTNTLTTQVLAAAPNPTDTVLVDVTGTAAAIVVTVTPNNGFNNGNLQATASLATTTPIALTSLSGGTTKNTGTLTLQVLAAAANPTDTVLVDVTGTAAAIVVTVTPNNGTNNAATPVNLTTAELAELINTAAVAGKNVTLTDVGFLRDDQTAIGGDATVLVDAGEGDGLIATFSGGTAAIPVNLTTAELVELINSGVVVGKTITLVDAGALRNDQTATGGDATVMVDAGEGDGVVATFTGGTTLAIGLTTAELRELINAGSVVGKTVTVTDASALRALQTATGGGITALADAGEGDALVATFAGGLVVMTVLVDKILAGVVPTAPHKQNLRKVMTSSMASASLGLEVSNLVDRAEKAVDMLLVSYGVGGDKASVPVAAALAAIKVILIS